MWWTSETNLIDMLEEKLQNILYTFRSKDVKTISLFLSELQGKGLRIWFTRSWAPTIKVHCLLSINWLSVDLYVTCSNKEFLAWTPLWTLPTPLNKYDSWVSCNQHSWITKTNIFRFQIRVQGIKRSSGNVKLIFLFKWSHRPTQWH